jgi:hypothetical protein
VIRLMAFDPCSLGGAPHFGASSRRCSPESGKRHRRISSGSRMVSCEVARKTVERTTVGGDGGRKGRASSHREAFAGSHYPTTNATTNPTTRP